MAAEWYYRSMGTEFGPLLAAELVQQAVDGKIAPDTEVKKGDGPWVPASKVAGLFDRVTQAKTNPPQVNPQKNGQFVSASGMATVAPLGGSSNMFEILDSAEDESFRIEILAYTSLEGAKTYPAASAIYFAKHSGMKLKQVRITLTDGEAVAEAGALHFMIGQIQIESKIGGISGLGKGMMRKFVTKEAAIMPRYRGTGQIYLEPSFSHFLIYRLNGEELIADKGMFCCGQGDLDISTALQKNVSSALFGGEGFFQTKVKGIGICVLESPVPAHEVIRVDLKDEVLQVDGNFALMRTGNVDFSVEKSTRSLLGTLTSGEGLLQTFRGTGSVWIAPTQEVYHRLHTAGLGALASASKSSSTTT